MKALVIFALSIIFSSFSYAVFTLANVQVLTQRLKALNNADIIAIIEKTDLIKQLAGKCYDDTNELLLCVRCIIRSYVDPRKLSQYEIEIIDALLQNLHEALAEFTRYYKISPYRSCRIS